jgi:hypothetical protein
MRKLLTIFLIGFLLSMLFATILPMTASAHVETSKYTTTQSQPMYGPPQRHYGPTVTYLKRGAWGNYYFAPTYITCRVYTVCFVIVNQTGRWVTITDTSGNFVCSMNPGSVCQEVFGRAGEWYYTDRQQNIRVPLTVYVQGVRNRCGWSECYAGWQH